MLPKEDDRRWQNQRDPTQRSYCLQRPVMVYPPYLSNHSLSPPPVYPMWGQSGSQTAGVQIWGPPSYPVWQSTESWHWKPFPGVIILIRTKAGYISVSFILANLL